MSAVFAVDLGATFLRTATVDADERVKQRTRQSTPGTAVDCAEAIRAAWYATGCPQPVAIAAAPLCDPAGLVLRWPNRPHYEGKSILPREWAGRVNIVDDGHAAALAAHSASAAVDEITVSLQVGTGIGAGAIVAGQLLAGRAASAMAVGHIKVPAAAGLPAAAAPPAASRRLPPAGHFVGSSDRTTIPSSTSSPCLRRRRVQSSTVRPKRSPKR